MININYMIPEIFIFPFAILIFWELIWKGIGLWKCGRNNQLVWFLFILIFNTAGILPIIYLLFFQKKTLVQRISKKVKKARKKLRKR